MKQLITLNQPVKKKTISNFQQITNPPTPQIPEGYITLEEFRIRATQETNLFCDKHGIH